LTRSVPGRRSSQPIDERFVGEDERDVQVEPTDVLAFARRRRGVSAVAQQQVAKVEVEMRSCGVGIEVK